MTLFPSNSIGFSALPYGGVAQGALSLPSTTMPFTTSQGMFPSTLADSFGATGGNSSLFSGLGNLGAAVTMGATGFMPGASGFGMEAAVNMTSVLARYNPWAAMGMPATSFQKTPAQVICSPECQQLNYLMGGDPYNMDLRYEPADISVKLRNMIFAAPNQWDNPNIPALPTQFEMLFEATSNALMTGVKTGYGKQSLLMETGMATNMLDSVISRNNNPNFDSTLYKIIWEVVRQLNYIKTTAGEMLAKSPYAARRLNMWTEKFNVLMQKMDRAKQYTNNSQMAQAGDKLLQNLASSALSNMGASGGGGAGAQQGGGGQAMA